MDERIIEKQPISLQNLIKNISDIGKKEMIPIQQKVYDFAKRFSKITDAKSQKLTEELKQLDITRLTNEHIVDIINIIPQDLAELKTIFVKTNTTLPPEDFKRINEIITKYKK